VDFNGDGRLDLISGDRNGFINYFTRKPDQTLTAEPDIIANGTTIDVGYNSAPCTVDWNEDGLLDMVIGNDTTETLWLYLNSGTTTNYLFTNYTEIKVGGVPIKYSRCVPHVVDLNKDGMKDLVIGEDYGYVYYLENVRANATPMFDVAVRLESDGAPISWPSGQTDTRVWVDDWDEDGYLDLLLGNYAKNLYLYRGAESLMADTSTVPETGGTVNFTLYAGSANGGRNYFVAGGASGTSPGVQLPGGLVVLPINWDWYSKLVLSLKNTPIFSDFLGVLDSEGLGSAQLNVPALPAGSAGLTTHYAYCCFYPYDYVSNPVSIEIAE
jgi:hypothetical protein